MSKLREITTTVYKIREAPIGISLFLIFLIALEIYYFLYSFICHGMFKHYGYTLGGLSPPHIVLLLFLYALIAVSLVLITYGFLGRKLWAKKFTIVFLVWATLWPIWGLIIVNNVVEHFILLVIYIVSIAYIMSASYVKEYFITICKYGDWTLYKRTVTLLSGKTLTIYFFSKKEPKSGTPTSMPQGYIVKINKRSNMPYLKKRFSSTEKNESKDDIEEKKDRSPSNVIYVVNRPQPGQLRGDWAVRGHGKIYSHHRIKQMAIKQARIIARKRDATVMIQKTDGTFSEGFKPRPKKRI